MFGFNPHRCEFPAFRCSQYRIITLIAIFPFAGGKPEKADVLVVGTWSMKAHLLSLPDLSLVNSHDLGGEVMPRSVLLATFDDKPYLLCGLGDGTLLSYRLEEGLDLVDRKKLALGTKPITLREFK